MWGVHVNVPEVKNSDVTDVELSAGSQADTGWNRHVAEIRKSVNDLQLLLPALVNAIDTLTPNSHSGSSTSSYWGSRCVYSGRPPRLYKPRPH